MLLKKFILGVFIRNGTTGILFSFSSRRQEEKGTTEDEMAGWHHRLNGHEFE